MIRLGDERRLLRPVLPADDPYDATLRSASNGLRRCWWGKTADHEIDVLYT